MNILSLLTQFWWLLVLIGVMILVHELGHFWAARAFDVKVDIFSFGFGPRLFGFQRGETDYRFSLFLFGGYVKMAGDQPGDEGASDPRGFMAKPRWQRLIIAFAGPFMNIVLAVGVLTGLFMVKYEKIIDDQGATIGHVMPDSPAAKVGIQAGDKIVRLNGTDNPSWEDIITEEIQSVARPLTVTYERQGQRRSVSVTPTLDERSGLGDAGWEGQNKIQVGAVTDGMPAASVGLRKGDLLVSVNGVPIHSRFTLTEVIRKSDGKPVVLEYERGGTMHTVSINPVYKTLEGSTRWMIGVSSDVRWNIQKTKLSFPAALSESLRINRRYGMLIVELLKGIVERRMPAKNLQGPVGIAQQATQAAQEGPATFLTLMSMVILNLAILNLLPIPILDGAMILTLLVEMIMGRDISLSVKEAMLKVGFVFLMMLMVFVLYNDIVRRITPGLFLN
ncbi:MAG: putative rane-associated zinc metalloprotease [Bryobacterales bacterium]|nr:putative rane-associated zinc metalloprotease [Bryobacterales bacterium]